MNKNGFTLIEVIVSLALLSLIGVAVGISLNKIFKNQEVKNYDEYVEKVKSSAILYANNTVDIINKLNSNYSYKVVTIKELVDKGYINKNLTNPETKEKINQEDSVRIYYNEDYEMMVEYPYTEKDEIYLYTMNYSIPYKSDEENLCYKGLNGSTLQLVNDSENEEGSQVRKLSLENKEIVAYMEDGSLCYDPKTKKSKIDTSKIGTYKIRYEYTIDGTNVNEATNKKIAERTITVKPSKPNIVTFSIKYQNENIKDPTFDANNAILNLQARDAEGLKLKYCLVATGENDTPSVTSCNGTSDTLKENTWINEDSNEINLNDYDINIEELFSLATKENKLKISVFVKNDFEEYNSMSNQSIYVIRNKLTLIYSYDSKTPSHAKIERYLKIGTNITDILKEAEIKDNLYAFEGWYTDKNGKGVSSSSGNYSNIYEDLTFYAKWYKYCTYKEYVKTGNCSKKCGGGTKTVYYNDFYYSDHECNEEGIECNTQACTTKPSSSGGGHGMCNKYLGPGYSDTYCQTKYKNKYAWFSSSQDCLGSDGSKHSGCCVTDTSGGC